LTLFIDGDQNAAKERIRKIFETAPKYKFEVAYESDKTEKPELPEDQDLDQERPPERESESTRVQVQLRTELVADTVSGMAIEAAQLLEGK